MLRTGGLPQAPHSHPGDLMTHLPREVWLEAKREALTPKSKTAASTPPGGPTPTRPPARLWARALLCAHFFSFFFLNNFLILTFEREKVKESEREA